VNRKEKEEDKSAAPRCRFFLFFSGLKSARSLANKRDRLSYLAGPKPLGKDRDIKEKVKKDKKKNETMKRKIEKPGIG